MGILKLHYLIILKEGYRLTYEDLKGQNEMKVNACIDRGEHNEESNVMCCLNRILGFFTLSHEESKEGLFYTELLMEFL